MVVQNGASGERLSQVEAILHLEGLAQRAFFCASTHCARADSVGVSCLNGRSPDVTGHPFFPQFQVDFGQGVTWHPGVQEGVRHVKHASLHVGDFVGVLANHLGQSHFADFSQLCLGEPDQRVAVFVPEPVAFAQVPELDADDARKRRAY